MHYTIHVKKSIFVLLVALTVPAQSMQDVLIKFRQEILELINIKPDLSHLTNNSPLLAIIRYNELNDLVELMLKHKANPNVQDKSGNSTLHHAATKNNAKAVSLLLQAKASINIIDNYGETPVHTAVRSNSYEALYVLLSLGANPNIQDAFNHTPLHIALQKDIFSSGLQQNRLKIIKMLLHFGASLTGAGKQKNIINTVYTNYIRALHDVSRYTEYPGMASLYTAEAEDYKKIAQLLIAVVGLYSKQSRIAHQGLVQVLPLEIAQHIASYLPEYAIHK